MIELPAESLVLTIGIALFFIWSFTVICFTKISVKHIENNMALEGKLPPEWDKGIGARAYAYAVVILLKNPADKNLIDVKATKLYARKIDYYLALVSTCLGLLFITIAGFYYCFY
jgi:hypothetical protein